MQTTVKPEVFFETSSAQVKLDKVQRAGAGQLLEMLLSQANLNGNWKVRVEGQVKCSSKTPPIIILQSQLWGVTVKIKPGDNDTAYRCILATPEGNEFTAQDIKNRLTLVASTVNDNWHHRRPKSVEQQEDAQEFEVKPKPQPTPEIVAKDVVKKDLDELIFAAYKASKTASNRRQFMRLYKEHTGLPGKVAGGTIATLVKNKVLTRKVKNYSLTQTAVDRIKVFIDNKEDIAAVLRNAADFGAWLAKSSERLKSIELERTMLLEQLAELNKEQAAICDKISGSNIELLAGLEK